jgi:transposase
MTMYPASALERAMKVQEVLLKAVSGEIRWFQAAAILGLSARSMRRWRLRYEKYGYTGLLDRRTGRPSPRRVDGGELQKLLRLYRERYDGFNVRHFHEIARREHGVRFSYTFVKKALQEAGLVKKGKKRGPHRLHREPKECFGEMVHLDGSPHAWLALRPDEKQVMISIPDDATKRLLYAQLWPAESTEAVLTALKEVVESYGIPMSLYTDRAAWAFHTPNAGRKVDKERLTQVGRALAQLGVEHIPAYSPQARGCSERLNRTLQDRLINELRVHHITQLKDANRYLREVFIPNYNRTFNRPARRPENVFVSAKGFDLDQILCTQVERTVAKNNTVVWDGLRLQIPKQPGRWSCEDLRVTVRRHLDQTLSVWHGVRRLSSYNKTGILNQTTKPRKAAETPLRATPFAPFPQLEVVQ